MPVSRHRQRHRIKRQYTFTKAKAVLGFIISAILSILLSTVIDAYQYYAYQKTKEAVVDTAISVSVDAVDVADEVSVETVKTLDEVEQKLKALK